MTNLPDKHPVPNRAARRKAGVRNTDTAQRLGKGHGKRFRTLQTLIKPPRIQDVMAAATTSEGTDA